MSAKYSELSNLFLVVPFIYAILKPENNIDFIYDSSFMLFIAEFLTIHSSAALTGTPVKDNKKMISLFIFYMVFVITFMVTTKSPQIIYFLVVSFFTKFFIHKGDSSEETWVKPLIVLLITTFLVMFMSDLLKILIPLPNNVLMQKPNNVSGLFVEVPQTILGWGIIYPIGLYLISFIKIPIQKISQHRS